MTVSWANVVKHSDGRSEGVPGGGGGWSGGAASEEETLQRWEWSKGTSCGCLLEALLAVGTELPRALRKERS